VTRERIGQGQMKVYYGIADYSPPPAGTTLTIGNFDGVHRGHQAILARAQAVAGELGTPVVAMTFDPHPREIIAPDRAPARLVTLSEKLHLLAALGVDACVVLRSGPALLDQPAETFLVRLCEHYRPRAFVEGPDFNFGHGRAGSGQTLRFFGPRLGFAFHEIDMARCPELPGAPSVHSAAIRAALREGRVDVAWAMLGRPYRIVGMVESGAGRGTGLGFPTANLSDIQHMLPQQAVYAAVAQCDDGSLHPAAVNIGPQLTFQVSTPRVEAHLLGWSAALNGRPLGLHLLRRLRGQVRYDSPAELAAQIRRDVAETRVAVAEAGGVTATTHPIPLVS
jgi:riboflavin kinase/FMN adenylyltransferase